LEGARISDPYSIANCKLSHRSWSGVWSGGSSRCSAGWPGWASGNVLLLVSVDLGEPIDENSLLDLQLLKLSNNVLDFLFVALVHSFAELLMNNVVITPKNTSVRHFNAGLYARC
jgi:hypothetical protein